MHMAMRSSRSWHALLGPTTVTGMPSMAKDAVQRGAQLMAHVRQEGALGPVCLGFGQLRRALASSPYTAAVVCRVRRCICRPSVGMSVDGVAGTPSPVCVPLARCPMFKSALLSLLLACSSSWGAVAFKSAHVIVVDEVGKVLLEKDAATPAPIASLTKLMTVMVVLDARQGLRIDEADRDGLKHSSGGVPVGAVVSRGILLELALIASDNHAASALARHYPGGIDAFQEAVRQKIDSLGLVSTLIEEPTGLSPNNRSSAQDMIRVLRAAASYPVISRITSQRQHAVLVNGRRWTVRNTNRLVEAPGWHILLSKTGFTAEAGRCLSMRGRTAGRTVMVVLLGAGRSSERALDTLNIHRWLAGDAPVAALPAARAQLRRALHPRPSYATEIMAERVAPIVEPATNKPAQDAAGIVDAAAKQSDGALALPARAPGTE
jgi:D-alanyl-D-alanine endopeptidase (penicillin-binding protein 7)